MFSKKISALIAVLLVSAFVLTGCKNKANTSSESSSTDVNSKPTVSSDDSHTEPDTPDVSSNTSTVNSKPNNNNISSQPHLHAYKITVVPPTCTEDGYTLYKCSCGRWYTEKGKAKTGHKWKEWAVTVMPTASTEGTEERVCEVCGEKETRTVEKAELAKPAELSVELLELINGARTEKNFEKLQLVTDGALAKIAEYLANGDTENYNAELELLKPEYADIKLSGYTDAKEAFASLTEKSEYQNGVLSDKYKFVSMYITLTDGKYDIVLFFADRSAPAE